MCYLLRVYLYCAQWNHRLLIRSLIDCDNCCTPLGWLRWQTSVSLFFQIFILAKYHFIDCITGPIFDSFKLELSLSHFFLYFFSPSISLLIFSTFALTRTLIISPLRRFYVWQSNLDWKSMSISPIGFSADFLWLLHCYFWDCSNRCLTCAPTTAWNLQFYTNFVRTLQGQSGQSTKYLTWGRNYFCCRLIKKGCNQSSVNYE